MIRGVYKFDNAALEIVKSVTKIKPEPWMTEYIKDRYHM